MEKAVFVLFAAILICVLSGCVTKETITPIDPRETKLAQVCLEIGDGWEKFVRKDIGMYFCRPQAQWGELREETLAENKAWRLSFATESAKSAVIYYSKVDYDDDFCWQCLDFNKSNEELKTALGLNIEPETVVKKLNIKGKPAIKITRGQQRDGKKIWLYDWYVPKVWLRGGYNLHVAGDSTVEKGVHLLIGSLEF